VARPASLRSWYARHGRHDLPWRATRDRWLVLVSEVMLHQTQVSRVEAAWLAFSTAFPTPEAMAAAGPGAVIQAWGRLGYPRRARRLYDAAVVIARDGWPDNLRDLPGVGRYTAAAVRAQADGVDVSAVDVNIRRVVQRIIGRVVSDAVAEEVMVVVAQPLRGRDRLLALMDLGALVCKPRAPLCDACPLFVACATRGELLDEGGRRAAPYRGSFRERRGRVLGALRGGSVPVAELDTDALASLVHDGLAVVRGDRARLP
jgi:A/G-specific adenine glycosylase